MVACPDAAPPPFACPTLEHSIQATAALLPRGKAWPASDPGLLAAFLAWLNPANSNIWSLPDVFAPADIWWLNAPASPDDWPAGYVQCGFVAALGAVRNWIESRFCTLKDEFFCASAAETLDLWNAEYGLPDACDPFPNLCAKASLFGATPDCAFWTDVAATLGWVIECADYRDGCGSQAGCCLAGTAFAGAGIQAATVVITVLTAQSSAYQFQGIPPLAGLLQAGMQANCLPDIASLACAFDRIKPAHYSFVYRID